MKTRSVLRLKETPDQSQWLIFVNTVSWCFHDMPNCDLILLLVTLWDSETFYLIHTSCIERTRSSTLLRITTASPWWSPWWRGSRRSAVALQSGWPGERGTPVGRLSSRATGTCPRAPARRDRPGWVGRTWAARRAPELAKRARAGAAPRWCAPPPLSWRPRRARCGELRRLGREASGICTDSARLKRFVQTLLDWWGLYRLSKMEVASEICTDC